ncbi:OsmC family protein [Ancylobacter sp. A5.8]|uniref:OsmC family protein n=1 Tax=Ancylobacter gelatini TaxID=2919920 RepID=UPI001F4DEF39|nr:OsmC family protein [Ancylobacter gelatini]MCJ8144386.1 OsmC family protein [Ancylobacter gelatini]
MATMNIRLRSIPDTHAALGWAGGHTVVVDRAPGKAGGMGLGFNGGELLGLAIGGCLCNDLQYVAAGMGIEIVSIEVDVEVSFSGVPLLATHAAVRVQVAATDSQADVDALIERAKADSTVSNSIQRGVTVEVARA